MGRLFNYKVSPTGKLFHESDANIKIVEGPFGSGKSTMAGMDLWINTLAQWPASDGVRYSRWGILRSTYGELIKTTRKSLLEVFPEGLTITQGQNPKGVFEWDRDGLKIFCELELFAIDHPDDLDKMKSGNWTGVWINEADTMIQEAIPYIQARIGRYPPASMGGVRWGGMIMDTNPPKPDHWLKTFVEESSENLTIELFKQPPAVFKYEDEDGGVRYETNPDAENLENLDGGEDFYKKQIAAHKLAGTPEEIDRLLCMLEVESKEGKPVFPNFNSKYHKTNIEVVPLPYTTTVCGFDTSGIHPAVAILQAQNGRWCITDEFYGEDMGLESFVEEVLIPFLNDKYKNCDFIAACDPSNPRDSFTGLTPSAYLKSKGFEIYLPVTNKPDQRITAVNRLLNQISGGLVVSKHCKMTLSAFEGRYRYKKYKIRGSVESIYSSQPEKNTASHIMDAVQYAALYIIRSSMGDVDQRKTSIAQAVRNKNRSRQVIMR